MSSKNNEADINEVSINDDKADINEVSSKNNGSISSKNDRSPNYTIDVSSKINRSVSTKNTESAVSTKNTESAVSTKNTDPAVSTKNTESAVSTKNTEAVVSTKNTESAVSTKNTDPAVSSKNVAISTKNIAAAVASKFYEADISHDAVDGSEVIQSTKSESKDDKGDKDDKNDKDEKGDKDDAKIDAKTESLIMQSAKSIRNWFFKADSKEDSTKVEGDVEGNVEGDVELGDMPTDYLFSLEVETKSGTALIYFQEGDDPHKLAKEFGAKHKFGKKLIKKLSIMIREKHLEYIKLSSVSEDGDESSPRSLKVTIYDIVNQVNKLPAEKARSPKASEVVSKVIFFLNSQY